MSRPKVIARFENPYLKDDTSRVARDPKRKLGPGDRLVTPALYAFEHGETPAHIATGITGALTYNNQQDNQARELAKDLRDKGIEIVMLEVSNIPLESPLGNLVKANYQFDLLKR